MCERGGDHTRDVLFDHAVGPRTGPEYVSFGVADREGDGPAVALVDHRLGPLIGERPRHRHRLWRGEREVEPGHRQPATRDLRLAADRLAGDRVGAAGQHRLQVLLGNLRAGLDSSTGVQVGQTGPEENRLL